MKWITTGFAIFLLLIVIGVNLGLDLAVFHLVYEIPFGDKVSHFFLTGLFSFFLNLTLRADRLRISSLRVQKGTLIVLAVVTLEEISQIFFIYRNFSLLDLAFDYTGILLFGYLAGVLVSIRSKERRGKSP